MKHYGSQVFIQKQYLIKLAKKDPINYHQQLKAYYFAPFPIRVPLLLILVMVKIKRGTSVMNLIYSGKPIAPAQSVVNQLLRISWVSVEHIIVSSAKNINNETE